MKKYVRKIFKFLGYLLLTLIILLIAVYILIQQPGVQNYIADKVAQNLSKTVGAEVSIGSLNVKFFNKVILEDVYVEDQQQDTLFYLHRIYAGISDFTIFPDEETGKYHIHVSSLEIENGEANLRRYQNDTTYNYEFLLIPFMSDAPIDTFSSASPWTFSVDTLFVNDLRFSQIDEVGKFDFLGEIGHSGLAFGDVDLVEQTVIVDGFSLNNSKVFYSIIKSDGTAANPPPKPPTIEEITSTPLIPDIGWGIHLRKLRMNDNYVAYNDWNIDPIVDALDFNHVIFSDLNIHMDDILYQGDTVSLALTKFSFSEKSGLELQELTGYIKAVPQQILVQDLRLAMPKTLIETTAILDFKDLEGLSNFVTDVELDINLKNAELAFEDVLLLSPETIEAIAVLKEQSWKGKILRLNGQINGRVADLQMNGLHLNVGRYLDLTVDLGLAGLPDAENMIYDVHVKELKTSYDDIIYLTTIELPTALDSFGVMHMTGDIYGPLDNLNFKNVKFRTSDYTNFDGTIVITGLPDVATTVFDVQANALNLKLNHIKGFIPTELPAEFDLLGNVKFEGQYKGTITDFNVNGKMHTNIGLVDTDLNAKFNDDYSTANYDGEFGFDNFKLGKLIGDDENLNDVKLQVTLKGSGMDMETLDIPNLEAKINQATYNNYRYRNASVKGAFQNQAFNGAIAILTPDIAANVDLTANFQTSIPEIDFGAKIDTINLKNLQFMTENIGLSTKVVGQLSGSSLDDLIGGITLSNLIVTMDDTLTYIEDEMALDADLRSEEKSLLLMNSFLDMGITGDYQAASLPKVMADFIEYYFPIYQAIDSIETAKEFVSTQGIKDINLSQKFTFEVNITDPIALTKLFVPDLTRLDSLAFYGSFDSEAHQFNMTMSLPKGLEYSSIFINEIDLNGRANQEEFRITLDLDSTDLAGSMGLAQSRATAVFRNDSLELGLQIDSDSLPNRLAINGVLTPEKGDYRYHLYESFFLNGRQGTVSADNAILLGATTLFIDKFKLTDSEGNTLRVQSRKNQKTGYPPIDVYFKNFKISEVTELLELEGVDVTGKINGKFTMFDLDKIPFFTTNLGVNDITLNKYNAGTLTLDVEQKGDSLDISSKLLGDSRAKAFGIYNISTGQIDMRLLLAELQFDIVDAFAEGMLSNSSGHLSGNIDIKGNIEQPELEGRIRFNQVHTYVDYLGMEYKVQNDIIELTKNTIVFPEFKLRDSLGKQEAVLQGTIWHDYFENVRFDLNLNTDKFQFLKTTVEDNSLFYGDVFLQNKMRITGTPMNPDISIIAKTLPGTKFFVSPLTYDEGITQEAYIIFGNPNDTGSVAVDTQRIEKQYKVDDFGMNLKVNFELTKEAELQIIIDPKTGDRLVCHGEAEMRVEMNPAGDINVFGDFLIDNGTYSFSFEEIVKRDFDIRKGSRLTFSGDPFNARFDIDAIYKTKTNPYVLIEQQSTGSEDENASQRTEVFSVLNIAGTLETPIISFDIELPTEQQSFNSSILRKLEQIKENETELNKQVFGLLFFNSFIADDSNDDAGFGTVGEDIALSSVSKLISNQLNNLAEDYIKGVNLTVDLDSYKSNYNNANSTVTELQVGLSKQLFDDRLTIQVEGNVNLDNNADSYTTVTGDFLIEYKLTPTGRYRLRLFRRSDYDALDANNGNSLTNAKNGLGLFIKRSFDKRQNRKKKKKEQREQEQKELREKQEKQKGIIEEQ